MAGLFPKNGVSAGSAINANDPDVTEGCEPLFYANKCNTKFDAAQANAVMSELLGGINVMKSYECDRTDNLHRTFELLRNMCLQTTRPFNGPNNSYFAGCFDGHSGKVPVSAFIDGLIGPGGDGYSICALPTKSEMNSQDTVGGCSGVDSQYPLPALQSFFNAGRASGPGGFLIGNYMGSAQDFRYDASRAIVPIAGLSCFFIHDLRATSGGQNPQDPSPFMINGFVVENFQYSSSEPDRALDQWRYGQIFPCFPAQNYQSTSPQLSYYMMNKSGACLQLPAFSGSAVSFTFSPVSDLIRFYEGTILF